MGHNPNFSGSKPERFLGQNPRHSGSKPEPVYNFNDMIFAQKRVVNGRFLRFEGLSETANNLTTSQFHLISVSGSKPELFFVRKRR
jgi:hypothetical protein